MIRKTEGSSSPTSLWQHQKFRFFWAFGSADKRIAFERGGSQLLPQRPLESVDVFPLCFAGTGMPQIAKNRMPLGRWTRRGRLYTGRVYRTVEITATV